MPHLYIIAGCNGAGKTTASFTILPEVLNVTEFVNADEIAKGLSPFQPEKVSIEAGRIMIQRINELLNQKADFALETTLASRRYIHIIQKAKSLDYKVHLVFLWLNDVHLAIERVKHRVLKGGHAIPIHIIKRRYHSGLSNFIHIYINKVDFWHLIDNTSQVPILIAEKLKIGNIIIYNFDTWANIQESV